MFIAVISDTAAVLGLVIAFAGVTVSALTGSHVADAVASIADGAVMMLVGMLLAAEARGLVIGEGARTRLLRDARRIVEADEHVTGLDEVRSLQLGPDDVLLVLRARFADDTRAADLPALAQALEERLRGEHPSIKHVLFDFD